jgi:hypothetical protein
MTCIVHIDLKLHVNVMNPHESLAMSLNTKPALVIARQSQTHLDQALLKGISQGIRILVCYPYFYILFIKRITVNRYPYPVPVSPRIP